MTTSPEMSTVVAVDSLRVELTTGRTIVDDISFDVQAGEICCLVGESGSGKTTVSMALLSYARHGAHIVGGTASLLGEDILTANIERRRTMRGRTVSYVAQDPAAAFNPGMRIKAQILETALAHGVSEQDATARMREVLAEVGLPDNDEFLHRYPHQLSGGQLQRVGIAGATMMQPEVLVLDEPTTGLDVTTQARVLSLVRDLCKRHGIAALYVTHDLAVVADIGDTVMVLRNGIMVEHGTVRDVFSAPQHDYTKKLLSAIPDIHPETTDEAPGAGDRQGPAPEAAPDCVLQVRDLTASYRSTQVLHGLSFDVRRGECLAIVGESGSGKSTLSKCLIGLHANQKGDLSFNGAPLPNRVDHRDRSMLQSIQYIFQSPHNSLNPRRTAGDSIGMAHRSVVGGSRRVRSEAVREALATVGLRPEVAQMYPAQLSGGERQRVSVARALVCRPTVLICDEITSALDVVVQASILDLLRALQEQQQLTMLFVTHNLAVVRNLADRVLVLRNGDLVELGDMLHLLTAPEQPYTQELIGNTLSVNDISRQRWGREQEQAVAG